MSAANPIQQNEHILANDPTCMKSVNRLVKLPVVESTIQTAHNVYEKVKDYNSVTNWTLQTAENTANIAVNMAKPYAAPVIKNFEGPIKKVDDVLCTGLDYVESKVPAVKMPTQEILQNTKDYVNPKVEQAKSQYATAKSYVDPAVATAKSYVDPAVATAKSYVEPAVATAKHIVEPYVEPIVENVKQKVEEYLHGGKDAAEEKKEEGEGEGTQDERQ